MTKAEAIQKIKSIQNGEGVDRHSCLDRVPRGGIAEQNWDDGLFTLGIEYGYIIALFEMFDISKDELREPRPFSGGHPLDGTMPCRALEARQSSNCGHYFGGNE